MPRPMSPARKVAIATNAKFYTGPRCKHGHDGERYTTTNACRQCVRVQVRPDRMPKRKRETNEFDALMKGN